MEPQELTGLDLKLVPAHLRAELNPLIFNCLRMRSNGIEYRMDYGRELGKIRAFLRQHLPKSLESVFDIFDRICHRLEIDPDEAREKIALAATWDQIRIWQEKHGHSDRMPALESHVKALFQLELLDDRAAAWHDIITQVGGQRDVVTREFIARYVENLKAIEVGGETVAVEDAKEEVEDAKKEDYSFEGDIPVVITGPVPHGTKDAQATEAPGEGPGFTLPPGVLTAIDRVSGLCGGDDPERRDHWRLAISDPFKIKFEDLLAWSKMDDEDVIKVGRLVHGNFHKGLIDAMRIVKRVIDDRSPLSLLKNECLAQGGRWEHLDGEFKITIIHLH